MSNQQSQESFRLLIKEIVVDEITHEKLNLLHWHLKLPLRLLDDSTPSMAILRSLEERRIMFKWSKEPETLIDILQQIGRDDLAVKVQEWLGEIRTISVGPSYYRRAGNFNPRKFPTIRYTQSVACIYKLYDSVMISQYTPYGA